MKKICILISFALVSLVNIANAGSSDWLLAKSFGGPAGEEAKDICTDASGNIYVTGFFNSPTITFGKDTLTSNGSGDIFVVKYDIVGNVIWARNAGGEAYDESNSICADAAGNVYVTGYFQSANFTFGKTDLDNSGNMDVFILKYDASGNPVWAKRKGGEGNEAGQSIHVDGANNLFVTGYFQSHTITFGKTTLVNNSATGTSDIFIAKYDPTGTLVWAYSAGGSSYDFGTEISTDANGNVLLTGYFKSPVFTIGGTTLKNASADGTISDIFIAKFDALGVLVWAKSAGGPSDDGSTGICSDAAGNVFITGYFQSAAITFGTVALTNTGSYDIFITKYDASGNVIWAKNPVGASYDYASGICTDTKGNLFLTGYFQSPTITFGTSVLTNSSGGSTSDIFVATFDPLGNATNAKSAGGTADDESNAICVDANGNVRIAGYFQSPTISFGSSTLTNAGSNDIFIAM